MCSGGLCQRGWMWAGGNSLLLSQSCGMWCPVALSRITKCIYTAVRLHLKGDPWFDTSGCHCGISSCAGEGSSDARMAQVQFTMLGSLDQSVRLHSSKWEEIAYFLQWMYHEIQCRHVNVTTITDRVFYSHHYVAAWLCKIRNVLLCSYNWFINAVSYIYSV